MGKLSRRKGRKGEAIAKLLLRDRDWTIIADTTSGIDTEDLIAKTSFDIIYSIEVKNRKIINFPEFTGQARQNAKKTKLPWMVMAKIHGTSSWLVQMQGSTPSVWHEKGSK